MMKTKIQMRKNKLFTLLVALLILIVIIVMSIICKNGFHITKKNSFLLNEEPDLVFSSPYSSNLFIYMRDELRIYDKNGEFISHRIDHVITKAYVCEDLYYIDDKQDLYKLDLETEKEERILSNVSDVSVSGSLCGAISNEGKLYLWGEKAGQYVDPSNDFSSPAEYKSETRWKDIEISSPHMLALDSMGNVYESNKQGENVTPLKKIQELNNISSIYSWGDGNIAVAQNGYIHYWDNSFDSKSDNPSLDSSKDIENIFNQIKPSHYAVGADHIVVYDDNKAYYMGYNGLSKENKGIDYIRKPTLDKSLCDYDNIYCGNYIVYLQKGLDIIVYQKTR